MKIRAEAALAAVGVLCLGAFLVAQNESTLDGDYLVRSNEIRVVTPTSFWVSGSGSDTNLGTQAQPFRTVQHACDSFGSNVCDSVNVNLASDYTGAGCRKKIDWCCHPGTDGGVVCGSVTFSGTRKLFARADGGTITATISAVTNGSASTGQAEEWSISNGDLAPSEIVGKSVLVSAGTGSGLDQLWPVAANDAGVITLNAHGELKTHPAPGSTIVVYDSPDTLINATLGQPFANSGPPSDAQVDKFASFVFATGPAPVNGAYNDRFITVQDMKTNLASGSLVASSGPGPINVRHIVQTNAAVLYRCIAGGVAPSLERNIFTGTGGNLMLAYNSALGCDITNGQIYNTYAPLATNQFFVASGNSRNLYMQSNFAPSALVRTGTCDSCRSRLDTFAGFRCTGDFVDSAGSLCVWGIDGDTLTGAGLAYTLNASHGRFYVDTIGQVFSTITAAGGGHSAALAFGSMFRWSPSTVFTGAGDSSVVLTDSISSMSIADIRAATTKTFCDSAGNCWGETGGNLLTPVQYPVNPGFGPPQTCYGTAVASGNVASVVFSGGNGCATFSSPPKCTCTPVITDGGTTTENCNPRAALVGSVDLVTTFAAGPVNWSCTGPR